MLDELFDLALVEAPEELANPPSADPEPEDEQQQNGATARPRHAALEAAVAAALAAEASAAPAPAPDEKRATREERRGAAWAALALHAFAARKLGARPFPVALAGFAATLYALAPRRAGNVAAPSGCTTWIFRGHGSRRLRDAPRGYSADTGRGDAST